MRHYIVLCRDPQDAAAGHDCYPVMVDWEGPGWYAGYRDVYKRREFLRWRFGGRGELCQAGSYEGQPAVHESVWAEDPHRLTVCRLDCYEEDVDRYPW